MFTPPHDPKPTMTPERCAQEADAIRERWLKLARITAPSERVIARRAYFDGALDALGLFYDTTTTDTVRRMLGR